MEIDTDRIDEAVLALLVSVVWATPCGSADSDEDEGPRRIERACIYK